MYGDGFELIPLLRSASVILLMGAVIKMMDDFLDLRYDTLAGTYSLAMRLGEGTLPYALIGFAVAALIEPRLAVSLMCGAYAVGMAGDLDRQLPSGLTGYQESAIVLLLNLLFLPWNLVVWAFLAMLALQLADDLHDLDADRASGNPNLVRRLGRVEALMLGGACLVGASALAPVETALLFAAVPIILWACGTMSRVGLPARRWSR